MRARRLCRTGVDRPSDQRLSIRRSLLVRLISTATRIVLPPMTPTDHDPIADKEHALYFRITPLAIVALVCGLALGVLFVGLELRGTSIVSLVLNSVADEGSKGLRSKFRRIARRLDPLIDAIREYDAYHGRPPESLDELVPAFLASVPGTGRSEYPEIEYEVFSPSVATVRYWYDLGSRNGQGFVGLRMR